MDFPPVSIDTLTPLWLGDVDRSSTAPKESGLIGSLRFWCEGLVRSFGMKVCEQQTRCSPDADEGLCKVCELFGATGWARRFRLELSGVQPVPVFFKSSPQVENASGNWLWNIFGGDKTGGTRKRIQARNEFTFGVTALWSPQASTIKIVPRSDATEQQLSLLALTLRVAAQLGGIGAKTQYGFGQVHVRNAQELIDWARKGDFPEQSPVSKSDLFTIASDRFFSILYEFPRNPLPQLVPIGKPPAGHDDSYIPCSFDIRYKYQMQNPLSGAGVNRGVRPAIAGYFGSPDARQMCGYVKGSDAWASRIHVSHLYRLRDDGRYHLKIWGDVDEPNQVLGVVHEHLMKRFDATGIQFRRLS